MKKTGKLTTDGKEIFEGDFIEVKTISKYPLVIKAQVKWDNVNNKWVNLFCFDEDDDIKYTIFKI